MSDNSQHSKKSNARSLVMRFFIDEEKAVSVESGDIDEEEELKILSNHHAHAITKTLPSVYRNSNGLMSIETQLYENNEFRMIRTCFVTGVFRDETEHAEILRRMHDLKIELHKVTDDFELSKKLLERQITYAKRYKISEARIIYEK